jgi:threonine/homoserine/homoserine lactone efflux protein
LDNTIWLIASFSFVVALSGALVPGPLLTYTIMKTLETDKRSSMVGVFVIAGHALLESVLVILLLAGFASLLRNEVTIRIIGTIGGTVLVYLGGRLIYDLLKGRVENVFLNRHTGEEPDPGPGRRLPGAFLGGVLISMSNPYWWIWWASIGLAFMVQYDISFRNPVGLIAFMAGHEAGDLAVYWLVSIIVALGRRKISGRAYTIVLFVCALVMTGFGLYLGISPHLL